MSASTLLAAAVKDTCDVVNSLPYRPSHLDHRLAFVAPADIWKQHDDDSYCDMSVGIDVFLVSGTSDHIDSFNWLDEQSTLLMSAAPVDVGDDTIEAVDVGAPFVFTDGSGTSLLACRVTYSRFRIGD